MRRFEAGGGRPAFRRHPGPAEHLAASGSLLAATAPPLELVRPGLAIYGVLDPDLPIAAEAADVAAGLQPSLSLKAHAVAFVDVPPGGRVGYGGRWQATAAQPHRHPAGRATPMATCGVPNPEPWRSCGACGCRSPASSPWTRSRST